MNNVKRFSLSILALFTILIGGYVYFASTQSLVSIAPRMDVQEQTVAVAKPVKAPSPIIRAPEASKRSVPVRVLTASPPRNQPAPAVHEIDKRSNQLSATLVVQGKSITLVIPERGSVYDMMNLARHEHLITFKEKEYSGMGFFIQEINGIANDSKAGRYWIYYINGKKASVGVSTYEVKLNDNTNWQYEQEE